MKLFLRAFFLAMTVLLLPGAAAATTTPPADPAAADFASPLQPVDTSSPSATYESLLARGHDLEVLYADYMARKTPEKAYALLAELSRMRRLFDVSGVVPALQRKAGASAYAYLADILARLPAVPPQDIPGAPGRDWGTLPDKWRIPGTEITLSRIRSGPQAGEYLFSSDTVENLPDYHARIIDRPPLRPVAFPDWHREQVNFTGPLIPGWVPQVLPAWAQTQVLDTPLWKEAGSLAILAVVLVLAFVWARRARRAERNAVGLVRALLWRLSVPLVFLVLYVLAVLLIRTQINLSGLFSRIENYLSVVLVYCMTAWAAWLGWFAAMEAIIASPRLPDSRFDPHLLRLTARLGGAISAGTILAYGANNVGIPALGLVAGLGVGGFALALASKTTVENLFGGLAIFADRPFRVGDFIDYGGTRGGQVEAIGSRSSRIRSPDGTLTTVPNSDLANLHISNLSMRHRFLFQHEVGLRYETTPEQIEWLLAAFLHMLASHPQTADETGTPRVAMTALGPSSIAIEVRAHVLTSDNTVFLAVQQQFLLEIMRLVQQAGTGFAFPSQTLYMTRDSGPDVARAAEIAAEARRRAAAAEPA